jgi:GDP-4-dehydro-6-deoxy-D-mannose reductase
MGAVQALQAPTMTLSAQRPLVTGAGGFAGSHLVELLAGRLGFPIDGTHRPGGEAIPPVLRERLRPHALDVNDALACRELVASVRPTAIYHLAGPAHIGESFTRPADFARSVFVGTVNVLEAAAALDHPPRTLLVSSCEVYGEAANLVDPLTEATPPLPNNPYGAAKLAAETYADFMVRAGRLPIVISRSFNHIGPRQSPRFATASFAKQLAEAERDIAPRQIRVGNLSAARDVVDVRDVVAGYVLLLERGEPGEVYNLASGTAVPMSDLLERLMAQVKVRVDVLHDASRDRPTDVATRRGSAAKAEALGWTRTHSLEQTLGDLMNHWRGASSPAGRRGG